MVKEAVVATSTVYAAYRRAGKTPFSLGMDAAFPGLILKPTSTLPGLRREIVAPENTVAGDLKRGIDAWEKRRGLGKPADMFIIRRHLGRTKGYALRVTEGNEKSQQKTMIAEWKRRTIDEADAVHAEVLKTLMGLSGFQGIIATSSDANDSVLSAGDVDWGKL